MISLFSPIYGGPNTENCAFLRGTTQFFDFGQRAYTVLRSEDGKVKVEESDSKPSWAMIALCVALLFTLFFIDPNKAIEAIEKAIEGLKAIPENYQSNTLLVIIDALVTIDPRRAVNLAGTSSKALTAIALTFLQNQKVQP